MMLQHLVALANIHRDCHHTADVSIVVICEDRYRANRQSMVNKPFFVVYVSIIRKCLKQVMEGQQRAAAVAGCRSAAQAERL